MILHKTVKCPHCNSSMFHKVNDDNEFFCYDCRNTVIFVNDSELPKDAEA